KVFEGSYSSHSWNHFRCHSLDTAQPIQFRVRVRSPIRHHLSSNWTSSIPSLWNPPGSILSKIQTKHTRHGKRVRWATSDPCRDDVRKSSPFFSSKFDLGAMIRSCAGRTLSLALSLVRLRLLLLLLVRRKAVRWTIERSGF